MDTIKILLGAVIIIIIFSALIFGFGKLMQQLPNLPDPKNPIWTICNAGWGSHCIQTYQEKLEYQGNCVITEDVGRICSDNLSVTRWK